jgi:hypothetical protein
MVSMENKIPTTFYTVFRGPNKHTAMKREHTLTYTNQSLEAALLSANHRCMLDYETSYVKYTDQDGKSRTIVVR